MLRGTNKAKQDLDIGDFTCGNVTIGGTIVYIADTSKLKIGCTGSSATEMGYIWFDKNTKPFKCSDGSGTIKTLKME